MTTPKGWKVLLTDGAAPSERKGSVSHWWERSSVPEGWAVGSTPIEERGMGHEAELKALGAIHRTTSGSVASSANPFVTPPVMGAAFVNVELWAPTGVTSQVFVFGDFPTSPWRPLDRKPHGLWRFQVPLPSADAVVRVQFFGDGAVEYMVSVSDVERRSPS